MTRSIAGHLDSLAPQDPLNPPFYPTPFPRPFPASPASPAPPYLASYPSYKVPSAPLPIRPSLSLSTLSTPLASPDPIYSQVHKSPSSPPNPPASPATPYPPNINVATLAPPASTAPPVFFFFPVHLSFLAPPAFFFFHLSFLAPPASLAPPALPASLDHAPSKIEYVL